MHSTAFQPTTRLCLHTTCLNRSHTLRRQPRAQARPLLRTTGRNFNEQLALRPVCDALDAASPTPDAGTPQRRQPDLKAVWKGLRLGAVVCLLAGACAALGYSLCTSALLATAGGSQKGVALAVQGAWTGLSAGFLHTLAGPDHLAGLAPITLGQTQIAATAMGALWGFGHSSGQLLLGLAFILLKEKFQGLVPILSKWSGTIVGLTLIAIGVMGIYESLENEPENTLDSTTGEIAASMSGSPLRKGWTTYGMGFLHGLHPDSLFTVLPALTLPTRLAAATYITMFVFGTVVAMAGYSLALGTASEAAKDTPWLSRNLSTAAGSVAIVIGFAVLAAGIGLEIPFFSI